MLIAQGPDAGAAGAVLVGALCGLVVGVALGTLIGAVILRASCSFFNRLGASSGSSVPEPSFGQAMLITFVTTVVNFAASFVVGMMVGVGGAAAAARGGQAAATGINLLAQAISLPITFLILAGMMAAMLPTSFGKACLVALIYIAIVIVIVVIIAVLIAVLFAPLAMG